MVSLLFVIVFFMHLLLKDDQTNSLQAPGKPPLQIINGPFNFIVAVSNMPLIQENLEGFTP